MLNGNVPIINGVLNGYSYVPPFSNTSKYASNVAHPLQENIGGTTYFYNNSNFDTNSISSHLPSSLFNDQDISLTPSFQNINDSISYISSVQSSPYMFQDFLEKSILSPSKILDSHQSSPYFAEPNLKINLHQNLVNAMSPNSFAIAESLYLDVDRYHTLIPLENNSESLDINYTWIKGLIQTFTTMSPLMTSAMMYKKSVYKCTDSTDGNHYCMMRIHGYSLTTIKMRKALNNWKNFDQMWCVKLREVFTTMAFGDSSLCFVYDYASTCVTLKRYLSPQYNSNSYNESSAVLPLSMRTFRNNLHHSAASKFGNSFNPSITNLSPYANPNLSKFPAMEEPKLWNLIIQMSGALRKIHSTNLFCGGLLAINHSKILIDPLDQMIKLNCLGMYEIMCNDNELTNNSSTVTHFQQEDIKAFGIFLLTLICPLPLMPPEKSHIPSPAVGQDSIYSKWLITSLKFALMTPKICDDLKNILLYLLTPSQQQQPTFAEHQLLNSAQMPPQGKMKLKNMNDIMPMIGARYYTHIENINRQYSFVKRQLSLELDNSRLFRLLCKINTIVERPEHHLDDSWSETGDRYLLKLFRDFLFHGRKPEDGTPFLDVSHIISHLNKLDIGSQERITLYSRDERNIIIVSYFDLRKCLQTAFQELFP